MNQRCLSLRTSIACLALATALAGCHGDGGGGDATTRTYSVSGSVSGAVQAGVTVALSGAATASTTTNATGAFTFSGLPNGTYAVAPSLAGYAFTPASKPVTVAGGDVAGQDFSASGALSISGSVAGAWLEGIDVTLAGAGSASTSTDAAGHYAFTGLTPGTYRVTPSLAGYAYSPATPSVTLAAANATQNFAANSVLPSSTLSGTISYGGTKSGRIYVGAVDQNCADCSPYAGTSVAGPGPFVIRGLRGGTYHLAAWMDTVGQGKPNASHPRGTATATITTSDVGGVSLALVDPIAPAPIPPSALAAFPGPGAALVQWEGAHVPEGEVATAYNLTWGTDANATTGGGSALVPARDDTHYFVRGLQDGISYYFKVTSLVGASASAATMFGPVPIGAVSGLSRLSGTVAFPGPSAGALYVVAFAWDGSVMRFTRIVNAASPQAYSITGLPDGAYGVAAILDRNDDGAIDSGDLANTKNEPPSVTIAGDTTFSVTLSASDAPTSVRTDHNLATAPFETHDYGIEVRVNEGAKRPVSVTLFSAPGIPVPRDVGLQWDFSVWYFTPTRPAIGSEYRLLVRFADGTTEIVTATLDTVLDAFAQNLAVVTAPPYSATVPLFTWQDPTSVPPGATYAISISSAGWWYPDGGGMPLTQHQVVYNVDGRASATSLTPGQTYDWTVSVEDASGNRSSMHALYTVP